MSNFLEVYSARKGDEAGRAAWCSVFNQVCTQLPEVEPDDVKAYLDSEWGGKMATDLMNGQSVASQVAFRKARFMKHFKQVLRNRSTV
jgi:hypothetical protein